MKSRLNFNLNINISGVLKSLSLATWGIEFYFNLSRNVGTVDTIVGLLDSNGKAHLGYSYW